MNGHFTTEIGRMRSAEMVAHGIRNQEQASILKRAEELDRPVVRRRHVAHRRALVMAALSSLFLAILSTTAFAYPMSPTAGQQAGAHEVVSNITSQPHVTSSTDAFTWILLVAVTCAVLVAFAATGARRVAHS
ncbi:MAG: hypothetical protein QOH26_1664 [Actinomycetota bacterium]|nr:hypothetical protein [Actinomycetota bacterium]